MGMNSLEVMEVIMMINNYMWIWKYLMMRAQKLGKNKGFTLIELIISLSILLIFFLIIISVIGGIVYFLIA